MDYLIGSSTHQLDYLFSNWTQKNWLINLFKALMIANIRYFVAYVFYAFMTNIWYFLKSLARSFMSQVQTA